MEIQLYCALAPESRHLIAIMGVSYSVEARRSGEKAIGWGRRKWEEWESFHILFKALRVYICLIFSSGRSEQAVLLHLTGVASNCLIHGLWWRLIKCSCININSHLSRLIGFDPAQINLIPEINSDARRQRDMSNMASRDRRLYDLVKKILLGIILPSTCEATAGLLYINWYDSK